MLCHVILRYKEVDTLAQSCSVSRLTGDSHTSNSERFYLGVVVFWAKCKLLSNSCWDISFKTINVNLMVTLICCTHPLGAMYCMSGQNFMAIHPFIVYNSNLDSGRPTLATLEPCCYLA